MQSVTIPCFGEERAGFVPCGNLALPMSQMGHSRPIGAVGVMSGLPPIATVGADIPVRQLRANRVTLVVGRPFPVYLDQRTFFGRRSVWQWGRADARAGEEGSDRRATTTIWTDGGRLG
jgi:hypothetical protein